MWVAAALGAVGSKTTLYAIGEAPADCKVKLVAFPAIFDANRTLAESSIEKYLSFPTRRLFATLFFVARSA